MSFLSRIKDMGRTQEEEDVPSEALSTEGMVTQAGAQAVDTQPSPSTIQAGATTTADSIISESAPSESAADFQDTRMRQEAADQAAMETRTGLPVIGNWRLERQQRFVTFALGLCVAGLLGSAIWSVVSAGTRAAQAAATGQALMQSQRLAKSVSQALIGRPQAFAEVQEASKVLASNVRGLDKGDAALGLSPVGGDAKDELGKLLPLVDRAEKNADYVLKQKQTLTQVSQALREVNSQSSELLDLAEGIA